MGCICCTLCLYFFSLVRLISLLVGWTWLQGLGLFVAGPLDEEPRLSLFIEKINNMCHSVDKIVIKVQIIKL